MQNYNLTILIKDKLDEKARGALIDDVKKGFGNLIREDLWGVRSLAYEIKHMDKAFYANFEFEAEPQAVITLDKNIRLNEDIIRYLLIKTKVVKQIKPKKKATEVTEATKGTEVSAEAKNEGADVVESEAEVKEEKPKKKVVRVVKKKA